MSRFHFLAETLASVLRRSVRWLAPLLLVTAGVLPSAHAQKEPPASSKERMPPAPQYAVAIISTLTLLVIVCMPSRKV